jgi:NTE family protein
MAEVYAVFEGGGVRGAAFAGAIAALEEGGITFKAVAGASAGAIVASLIAAGYDAKELRALLVNTDFTEFKDAISIIPLWKSIRVWDKLGFHRGKRFERWIEETISLKLTGNLNGSPRFRDLPKQLKVIATDIVHEDVEIFDRDSTPQMRVADAVRMSMSIPFFFCPVQFGSGLVVDGGVSSNFPAWAFEKERKGDSLPILGLRLQPSNKPRQEVNNLWQFTRAVLSTMMKTNLSLQINHLEGLRVILLPTLDIGTTEFDISKEKKEELYTEGYETTRADLWANPIA